MLRRVGALDPRWGKSAQDPDPRGGELGWCTGNRLLGKKPSPRPGSRHCILGAVGMVVAGEPTHCAHHAFPGALGAGVVQVIMTLGHPHMLPA
eukprot:13220811-Heterocapsa_arctica.AAC.2